MNEISSKKTEAKAINKINNLIEKLDMLESKIDKNNTNISWDGTIDLYHGNIDKKENFDCSIDVQVKGRTTTKKRINDKSYFDIDKTDLENYLKKDGTLFLMGMFKRDSEEFKIYYASLLPYDLKSLLKNNQNSNNDKIKIKTKEIKNAKHLEKICRNFQINKDIQKKFDYDSFNSEKFIIKNGHTVKFSVWENNTENLNPGNLVGTEQYFYVYDENKHPIGMNSANISTIVENINAIITDCDKTITYDKLEYETKLDETVIKFGKAFEINKTRCTFNIKIKGTFKERLKQYLFIEQALINKCFLINDKKFTFDPSIDDIKGFEESILQYKNLNNILEKHRIHKDLNFEQWDSNDFERLNVWLNAIEDKVQLKLKSDISRIGSITIKDLSISIIAIKKDNGSFDVRSIWNDESNIFNFMYSNGDKKIYTNNLFMNLNYEAYLSDDINYDEMIKIYNSNEITKEECFLVNFQVLEIIKAYDIKENINLLNYAEFLVNKLMQKDTESSDIYYINYCQILKRKQLLSDKEIQKLIDIKNKSTETEIKLCCNILIDNVNEVNSLLKIIDSKSLEEFKKYPISKFIK